MIHIQFFEDDEDNDHFSAQKTIYEIILRREESESGDGKADCFLRFVKCTVISHMYTFTHYKHYKHIYIHTSTLSIPTNEYAF